MAQNEVLQPEQKPGSAKTAAGAGGAATVALLALSMAVSYLKPAEGLRYRTYLDVASVPTYCYGHADRNSKVGTLHSPAECEALLNSDASKTEAGVEKCAPAIKNRPFQLAASTRLAFNIGTGAFCKSSIARNFNAGNFKAACAGFPAWRFAAGKPVLLARRNAEMAMCNVGI